MYKVHFSLGLSLLGADDGKYTVPYLLPTYIVAYTFTYTTSDVEMRRIIRFIFTSSSSSSSSSLTIN